MGKCYCCVIDDNSDDDDEIEKLGCRYLYLNSYYLYVCYCRSTTRCKYVYIYVFIAFKIKNIRFFRITHVHENNLKGYYNHNQIHTSTVLKLMIITSLH